MPIFYTPDILKSNELPLEEARHCSRVLRLVERDRIDLVDGLGGLYEAEIALSSPKKCLFNILKTTEVPPSTVSIHLAMGPTKNMDRNEWVAEKCTEIGLSELTFLNCRFSERKVIKDDRVEKILVSAMKQSKRAHLPKLHGMLSFKEFISQPFDGQKFIAHCYDGNELLLKNAYKPGSNALILIGPEGDFSPEEIDLALKYDFQPISLGDSRLRTETAAVFACSMINILNQ
ncbi:16S rRNA (uracil(1498)-N(3))-methyltransferase [Bacteroides propionicifaciens]|jgi:16S rRNA (uracil1498-N3)-methyltransferase|uniref:16S rRNA (uracil(1498)-N(3))-methyltransferase n=1 Tax=Bacteroides propionicifaciens TaxID=392838 RepID=UPI00037B7376|nr:16S rRNA (uracil(1498)-N(3))-methyltransferase [Bacteroides propionicifaciens]